MNWSRLRTRRKALHRLPWIIKVLIMEIIEFQEDIADTLEINKASDLAQAQALEASSEN